MSYLCLSSQNSLLTRGRGSRVAPVAPLQRHSNRINCGCNSRYFQLDHAEYSPPKTDHRTTRSSFTGQRSNPPPMDWSSSCNSRCPSDPIRKSDRFTLLCLPSDAREAMVEPLFIDRYARDRNRTWPEPTAEVEWCCRMESLPLMLQAAVFLLGGPLSRCLWEVNINIAAVVLGVTSFGALFYVFIVIAGTISESCPYQTPVARILRPIIIYYLPAFRSSVSSSIQESACYDCVTAWWYNVEDPQWSDIHRVFIYPFYLLSIAPAADIYHLGRVTSRSLIALSKRTYHHSLARTER